MKLSYKQKLFLYIFIIFALFTAGIVIFEQAKERKTRTEILEGKLDAYAEIVYAGLSATGNNLQNIDSITRLLPQNIRLTIIDKKGNVLYDNNVKNISYLENHSVRPEIMIAHEKGKGTDIRTSASNNKEYLYYAKKFNNYYIRTALPYDIQTQRFIKPDNLFIYFIIAFFLVTLFVINIIVGRFGKSIQKLRDFTLSENKDQFIKNTIEFPHDELGEIGTKIIRDYNYLQESKKTIALEREKLLQHVHTSEEGLCFFSADKKIEYYNGLFMQYLNTIIGNTSIDPSVILSDDTFKDVSTFIICNNEEKYFETQINKQGKHFTIRVNIFDDNSFEIILNDTTKHEKVRQLKQEITGNIAHELRTPVTSIRAYLETVLGKKLSTEKEHHFIQQAYDQSVVLSELIQDMGLITKMEEAPNSFNLTPININELLNNLKNDLQIPLREKGIKMEWDIPENLIINGNQNLIYSIFRNLTDNVIRYAGENVTITITKYNQDKQFYYFSYSDNGVGISDESHLNRLFERFYRITEGRTRDSGGSGLGLSIVKNAIAFHKGSIVVKNKKGVGLEFLFTLKID
ncbi:MAG: two-component sensor histidine kinase [Bacteroidales bacterium]|jgi:signal transduction histidine kinase|nr:two-component sensor histidine kinase [Bacteroidales bacterium]